MADLDRGMEALRSMAEGARAESAAAEETPNIIDMLIVSSGGVLSVSIAALGIWKFVELVV